VLLALWRSAAFRRVLAAVSLPTIHGLQVYRILGFMFLILLALGLVPAHFGLPAAWGDIAVGVLALPVAFALARGAQRARLLAAGWNVLGILDFVVAVGMGTGLLAPYLAPGLGPRVPGVAAMAVFPMLLVPNFIVPISIMLHLLGLSRLLERRVWLDLGERRPARAASVAAHR
jgi:hypothetical protein